MCRTKNDVFSLALFAVCDHYPIYLNNFKQRGQPIDG
jgi:hypothetical protein